MSFANLIIVIGDGALVAKLQPFFEPRNIRIELHPSLRRLSNKLQVLAVIVSAHSVHSIQDIYTHSKAMRCPLIVVDDAYDSAYCVQCLESGADDYLVKPIDSRELNARIRVILKRLQQSTEDTPRTMFFFNGWRLYPRSRVLVDNHNKSVDLSNGEFLLLVEFLKNPNSALTRDYLIKATKKKEMSPFDRCIDVQISRLRQKIEEKPNNPKIIKTLRNQGYVLNLEVEYFCDAKDEW